MKSPCKADSNTFESSLLTQTLISEHQALFKECLEVTRGADRGLKSVWPIQPLRELLSAARHSETLEEESPDSVWLVSSPTEQAACFAAAFNS